MTSTTAAVAAGIAVATARQGRSDRVEPSEEHIFRLMNQLPDRLHTAAWSVMQLGSLGGAVVVGALEQHRSKRMTTLATGVALWAGVKAVKRVAGHRGRPAEVLDRVVVRGQPQRGRGWPSGHAAVSLGVVLVADVPTPIRRLLVAGAAATGLSRMYVGAHLPADVAGGWAIGVLTAHAARRIASHRI